MFQELEKGQHCTLYCDTGLAPAGVLCAREAEEDSILGSLPVPLRRQGSAGHAEGPGVVAAAEEEGHWGGLGACSLRDQVGHSSVAFLIQGIKRETKITPC